MTGGDVTIDHLLSADHTTGERLGEIQVDRVVAGAEPDEGFEPRHTSHGFQYVRVEGLDRRLGPDDVTGVVVHTDLRRTGWFHCSDERINRLHDAAVWSFRDNACDIPTDCPQRERSGWTGDWQLFVPTAAFLYDVAGFSLKWLRDLAAEQRADGLVLNIAPEPRGSALWDDPIAGFLQGSAGWGDAAVHRPVGAVPGLRRPRPGRGAVAAHGRLGGLRRGPGPGQPPTPAGRGPAGARRPRGVPLGHRLPLGRVVRAGRQRPRRHAGERHRPPGHRLPPPLRRPPVPHGCPAGPGRRRPALPGAGRRRSPTPGRWSTWARTGP